MNLAIGVRGVIEKVRTALMEKFREGLPYAMIIAGIALFGTIIALPAASSLLLGGGITLVIGGLLWLLVRESHAYG